MVLTLITNKIDTAPAEPDCPDPIWFAHNRPQTRSYHRRTS
ncbi:hypothetical protein HMPREF9593_02095 [Cutibacterium acnes HL046PA2]|nr:hypothetical protein HMPREF9593_02095 [Cutibacterium acnes HL046PA2]